MTKWTKAVPDYELDTAFFNNYFISLTEKRVSYAEIQELTILSCTKEYFSMV